MKIFLAVRIQDSAVSGQLLAFSGWSKGDNWIIENF